MSGQSRSGTVHGVGEDYLVYVVPADHDDPAGIAERLTAKGYKRRAGRAVSVEGMPGAQVWAKLLPGTKPKAKAAPKAKTKTKPKTKAKTKAKKEPRT